MRTCNYPPIGSMFCINVFLIFASERYTFDVRGVALIEMDGAHTNFHK